MFNFFLTSNSRRLLSLNSPKTNYFKNLKRDYIARPEILQDVAFGKKVLKLDTGGSIIIPGVIHVRTMIPSSIVEQYSAYCKEQNFEPAGQRSPYRIIEVCGASKQKSLQGLDNITAEGTEAIDNVTDVLKTLGDHGSEATCTWVKHAEQKIKEAKRYLKTEFKLAHVGRDETCADHCTAHALGDTSDSNSESICQHKHETECEQCESHCKLCLASIQDWRAHLLRTQNQEEGK